MKEPTEAQILGARVRAARDSYELEHRKPYGGGWEIPPNKEVYAHLSRMFGLTPVEVSYFMTYSRSCTHEWAEGACYLCPTP